MNPKSRTTNLEVVPVLDELHVLDKNTDVVHRLHPITALVWHRADGSRSVSDLLALVREEIDPEADAEAVWQALDALADANLLEARVAPPAGVQHYSRRAMIARTAGVGAALSSLHVMPLLAQSTSGSEQTSKEQKSKGGTTEEKQKQTEQRDKQSEQKSKQNQNAEQKQKQTEQKDKQSEQKSKQNQNAEQKQKQTEQKDKQSEQKTKQNQNAEQKQKQTEQKSKQNQNSEQKQKKQQAEQKEKKASEQKGKN